MARIVYSDESILDMEQTGDYIAEKLKNPIAALNTVNSIQDRIDKLEDFPLMGARLSSIFAIDTDYRFLVCGNHLAFYRVQGDYVYIDRILHGKQDYISVLFSDLQKDAALKD